MATSRPRADGAQHCRLIDRNGALRSQLICPRYVHCLAFSVEWRPRASQAGCVLYGHLKLAESTDQLDVFDRGCPTCLHSNLLQPKRAEAAVEVCSCPLAPCACDSLSHRPTHRRAPTHTPPRLTRAPTLHTSPRCLYLSDSHLPVSGVKTSGNAYLVPIIYRFHLITPLPLVSAPA